MPKALVRSGELYYEVHGAGPPVLLTSGLGGLGSFWCSQRSMLARHFTVITYDHRGSGQSTKSPPPYAVDAMADDVLALMDHLDLEQARFVGHSTGGAIGQTLAARYPGRFERLVLSATWTHCDPYFRRLFTLRRDIMRQCDSHIYARLATLLLFPADWIAVHDQALTDAESQRLEDLDRAVLTAKIDALLEFDSRALLSTITCPTLVIAARDDVTVPSYFAHALARAIPNARLAILESGGHYCPISRAREYGEILMSFLGAKG